ncbi:protein kinase domain-containing protein [Haliea sp. E17]|uniref:protein kinase domain-containing protein n=1 Tax=Haliea sp. E17 TaxID=3401576 RepID=UPI003AAF977E
MNDQAIPPQIGKYRIVRPLGRGGMGQVYLAEDTRLERQVAIKCLRPELNQAHWQENLKREALVLARLNHPNIVQIHDIVEFDDSVAIVTEYVEGRNLHITLRERNPGYAERTRWLAEISAGLAAAHAQGISHNDLKPENILIGAGNDAKINDFGIASTDSDLSEDILALGHLAQELVADSADTSPLLGNLVQRMLSRRKGQRPGAEEVAAELRYIWLETTQTETPLPPSMIRPPRSRGRRWFAVALATILLIALAAYLGVHEQAGAGKSTYVAVLPARLDIDAESDSRQYALLASSVQQGLYQAVMQTPGYSLVSPSEAGRQTGSPAETAAALNADEILVPQLKCVFKHCELSTERLIGPEFQLANQRTTALLPELTLEAYQIAARQWNYLTGLTATDGSDSQSISEEDYRQFLQLYEGSHYGEMSLENVITSLDTLFSGGVRFMPATNLYVYAALELFHDTGESTYLAHAQDVLRDAERWSGDTILLHRSWFHVALESGDFTAAEHEIVQLRRLGADEAYVLALEGDLFMRRGQFATAAEYYSSVLKLRPTKVMYHTAALAFYYTGDDETALALINSALDEYIDDGKFTNLKGLILLDRGELDAAIAEFETSIDRRPRPAGYSNLGLAHLLRGDYREAYENFTRAVDIGDDGRTLTLTLNLADALMLLGEQEEAKALYYSLVTDYRTEPDSVRVSDVAQALAHLGEFQAAIQLIDDINEKSSETYFSAALVYSLAGQSLAAIAKIDQALQANMGFVWFSFPWFDKLCAEPAFAQMMTNAGDPSRCTDL